MALEETKVGVDSSSLTVTAWEYEDGDESLMWDGHASGGGDSVAVWEYKEGGGSSSWI